MPAASLLPDEQARELAREILSRPEYAVYRLPRSALQERVDRLADWIRTFSDFVPEWLVASLREMLGYAFGEDAGVVALRLALAVLLFVGFGWLAGRGMRKWRAHRAASLQTTALSTDADPAWLFDAEGFAKQGRFIEAARCAQLASLQLLLRKRWLELERSDPNRTLRRRLAEARLPAALRARFVALLDRLEGCWFRDRIEDRDLYSDWRALHAEITSLPEAR
jgi:hypothetical protein